MAQEGYKEDLELKKYILQLSLIKIHVIYP